MARLAVEDIPQLKVIDTEVQRTPPLYTIDTIQALQTIHQDCTFYLLLGDDLVSSLQEWKEVQELVHLAPPLVGLRSGYSLPPDLINSLNITLIEMPIIQITATQIRARLKAGQTCFHLVPGKVLDFIVTNQLY